MTTTALPNRTARGILDLPAFGLGCWAIGGPFTGVDARPSGYAHYDDAESRRAIRRALDIGVTYFDTADIYGTGHSERLLGEALGTDRARVQISTKFGSLFQEGSRHQTGESASPEHIRSACDASLRRLGTDHVDLYFLHLWGYPIEAIAPVLETLEELVADGKIRAYGWSTDRPDAVREFARGVHCAAVQQNLNVFEDAPELLALCDEVDLVSVNRTPLAMGFLSGKYDPATSASKLAKEDVRGTTPVWVPYFKDGGVVESFAERLAAVREVLTSGGRTLPQGALAWIWARSARTVPIPGFRTVAQVEENAAALEKGPLSAGQMAEIDRLLGRAA